MDSRSEATGGGGLLSIARKGALMGLYSLNGLEFWSAELNARDRLFRQSRLQRTG